MLISKKINAEIPFAPSYLEPCVILTFLNDNTFLKFLFMTTLLILFQGLCMIVGGIKYRSQRFNPKSASVTAIFLFVAIIGEYTF